MKKFFICFLALMLTVYPASAGEVTLNRWVLNVIIHDDGLVEEIIQTEIENAASSPLDGFSFVVPATKITMPNISSFSPNGQAVELQNVAGGTKILINFNAKLETGKKWDGRLVFNAENWAVKEGSDYSINISVDAPQAVISGKYSRMSVATEPEIRSQVFLPKSINPTSVEPSVDKVSKKPAYKKLLQYNKFAGSDIIVLTWFNLNIGDVIRVKGSFSSTLNKIVEANEKFKLLSNRVNDAKAEGKDVSEAEVHLLNARDYNNQALDDFWRDKDVTSALDAANNEMKQVENSLSVKEKAKETPQTTESKKTPGFGVIELVLILLVSFAAKKKNKA